MNLPVFLSVIIFPKISKFRNKFDEITRKIYESGINIKWVTDCENRKKILFKEKSYSEDDDSSSTLKIALFTVIV